MRSSRSLTSDAEVPATGQRVLGVRFTKDGDEKGIPVGTAELYIDDKPVGQARIRTQPGELLADR